MIIATQHLARDDFKIQIDTALLARGSMEIQINGDSNTSNHRHSVSTLRRCTDELEVEQEEEPLAAANTLL